MQRKQKSTGPCATENCGSHARTRGMCGACYSWQRHKLHKIHDVGPAYMTQYKWQVTRLYTRTSEFLSQKLEAREARGGAGGERKAYQQTPARKLNKKH